jgi:HK97 gp10 family phage protein
VIRSKARNYPTEFAKVNAKFLPSAAALIEGAAKRNTPVDTGRLRASISSRSDKETATVFTPTEYAPYVEYGTKRQKAQPFMRTALDKNRKKLISLYRQIFRGVFRG